MAVFGCKPINFFIASEAFPFAIASKYFPNIINVIIIAALALIVLVVLVAVFTGRIGKFEEGVSASGDAELVKMRTQYGRCHPTATKETAFRNDFANTDSVEAQDQVRTFFEDEIDRCASIVDEPTCESSECKWS